MSGAAAESLGVLLAVLCCQIGVPLLQVVGWKVQWDAIEATRILPIAVCNGSQNISSICINPLRHPNGHLHVPPPENRVDGYEAFLS